MTNIRGWALPPDDTLIRRHPLERVYLMSDGREWTVIELLKHGNNIYGVAANTIRTRLSMGVRDIDAIFKKRIDPGIRR